MLTLVAIKLVKFRNVRSFEKRDVQLFGNGLSACVSKICVDLEFYKTMDSYFCNFIRWWMIRDERGRSDKIIRI